MIFLITILIQYNGFSQDKFDKIRISNDIEFIKLSENAYVYDAYYE